MSKSLGNFIPAKSTLEELGADAVRFYYCSDIAPGQTQKFSLETIRNDVRKFFSIWGNLVRLVKGYGEHFSVAEMTADAVEDKWLLSRLHATIRDVRDQVESFELHLVGRSLHQFVVEDLSRTYVQFVRDRLDEEDAPARLIGHSLWLVARLAAAIAPFQSEQTYADLKDLVVEDVEESVHLDILPVPEVSLIDEELESSMVLAGEVIGAILAARDKAQIGVRWPLAEAIIDTEDEDVVKAIALFKPLILKQTNVRSVKVESFVVEFDGKPNYQSLGKSFGEKTGDAAKVFAKNKQRVIAGIVAEGKISIDGFEFLPEHVNLEKIVPDSHACGECKSGSVYLRKEAPEELVMEGFSREVMRRLQQLRKDAGLEKHDRIEAFVATTIADKLQPFLESIESKVGADKLVIVADTEEELPHVAKAKVRGVELLVMLKKIS
jgi:isoleucyl-tRNA synthetase